MNCKKKKWAGAIALALAVFCAAGFSARAEEAPPEESPPEGGETLCLQVGDLLRTEDHASYLSGDPDGSIRPDGPISRAEAAQLFYRLLREEPEPTAAFSDVKEEWYAQAVNALASLGALKGYDDGTFRPQEKITRAEFITVAAQFSALLQGEVSFSDVGEDHWAGKYISSAVANGWLSGYPDGTFRPGREISRAEAVTVINAMLGRRPEPSLREMVLPVRFPDVSREHWAFPQLCEAAVSHQYALQEEGERWTDPSPELLGGWDESEGVLRYRDYYTGEFYTGFHVLDGYTYYFDPETGGLMTGWQVIGGKNYLLPGRDQAGQALEIGELLTQVNYNVSNREAEDIRYITVHYTATPGDTALGECQAFRTTYRAASAHYFVDESSIWRCVRDKDVSWHCGNSYYTHEDCRNSNSIGIEMCCRKEDAAHHDSAYDPDWYFMPGTVENTAALVRELMMKYGVPLENVVRHNDVSHKTCPAPYVNDFSAWQEFLQIVSEYQTDYDGSYQAQVTANLLNVRSGPGTDNSLVRVLNKGDVVTVLEEYGNDGQPQRRWARVEDGWVSYQYLCRLAG